MRQSSLKSQRNRARTKAAKKRHELGDTERHKIGYRAVGGQFVKIRKAEAQARDAANPLSVLMSEDVVLRTPTEIVAAIGENKLDPKTLDTRERRMCVADMWLRGIQIMEMASVFKVSPATITQDTRVIRDDFASMADEIDTKRELMLFYTRMNMLYGRAMREKDFRLAADITKATVDTLHKMGLLPQLMPQPQVPLTQPGQVGFAGTRQVTQNEDGSENVTTTFLGNIDLRNCSAEQLALLRDLISQSKRQLPHTTDPESAT